MQGEDLATQEIVPVQVGAWAANGMLVIIGFIFLRMAQRDGRLFEFDFINQLRSRLIQRILGRVSSQKPLSS
jgi:hypothetical protein